MTLSRRALLGSFLAGTAAVIAGCSSSVRSAVRSQAAPVPSVPPVGTSTARSSAAGPTAPTPPAVTGAPRSSASPTPAGPPRALGPARQVSHGPSNRGEVALTFHGAGDPVIAHQLLAIFRAHRAHVTVLGVGTWLAANPLLAKRIVADGHELGNHTYHHLDIDSLDEQQAHEEIFRCRDLLLSLIGSPGAHFRQSQSQTASTLVRRLAGSAGYRVCLSYDVDSLDYTDPGPTVVRSNVAQAQAGSIVSMHFGHAGTVEAMPAILTDLAARGLRPVTASELLR